MAQEGTPVNLGEQLGQPQVSDSGRDIADATSQSPLAQSRGTADPIQVNDAPVRMGMK